MSSQKNKTDLSKSGSSLRRKSDFKNTVTPMLSRMGSRIQNEKFFFAIYTRNIPEITKFLDKGVDPNFHHMEYGATPLHLLAERNDSLLGFRLLQTKKLDVDIRSNHGYTALHLTCFANCKKFAHMLLTNGADMNAIDRLGKTPLHLAVDKGHYGIVLKLLHNNANVNVIDFFENTPLSLSVLGHGKALFARTLIRFGANMSLESQRSLHIFFEAIISCRNISQIDTILLLLDNGVDVNLTEPRTGRNCLHFVAITGYLELAVILVDRGANLNTLDARLRTPAKTATAHQNYILADYFRKGYRPPNLLKALPLVYLWVNKLKAKIDENRARKELEDAVVLADDRK